jgi:hypothetical protein
MFWDLSLRSVALPRSDSAAIGALAWPLVGTCEVDCFSSSLHPVVRHDKAINAKSSTDHLCRKHEIRKVVSLLKKERGGGSSNRGLGQSSSRPICLSTAGGASAWGPRFIFW